MGGRSGTRAGCPFAGLKSSILVLSVVHYARGVHSLWLKFYSRLCHGEYSVIRWRNSISAYLAILSHQRNICSETIIRNEMYSTVQALFETQEKPAIHNFNLSPTQHNPENICAVREPPLVYASAQYPT